MNMIDLIEHEIVLVRGKYYSVQNVRKSGTVVLKYLPNYKFVDWEGKKKDLEAEKSVKRCLAIPEKRIECENLFTDLRIHFLRKVDEILKR